MPGVGVSVYMCVKCGMIPHGTKSQQTCAVLVECNCKRVLMHRGRLALKDAYLQIASRADRTLHTDSMATSLLLCSAEG
jgi:hypothetical protein